MIHNTRRAENVLYNNISLYIYMYAYIHTYLSFSHAHASMARQVFLFLSLSHMRLLYSWARVQGNKKEVAKIAKDGVAHSTPDFFCYVIYHCNVLLTKRKFIHANARKH
jgi:hypothetical protein